MIVEADSGSGSSRAALKDSDIKKLDYGSCLHNNYANCCANGLNQLLHSPHFTILSMGSNDYDNCGRQWQSQLHGSLEEGL